jgi:hypothetical protein
MGWRRSSNLEDRPSFHLRNTVQKMATPATHDAITITTVKVVFFDFDAPDWGSGMEEVVGTELTDSICVTVDLGGGTDKVSGAEETLSC